MTTLEQRAATIPPHRRKAQAKQTLWGILAGTVGCGLVYAIGASQVWYLVAVLFGLRLASRELLMDCLKIARDLLTFQRGKPNDG